MNFYLHIVAILVISWTPRKKKIVNFIVKPCIDTIGINSNQLMYISVFITNTLKVHLKFLLPRQVSDHIGFHPQGAIIRS